MECDDSPMTLGRWEDLNADILLKIFECFANISDSSSAIRKVSGSAVCKEWRSTLCDPRLWNKLDFSTMKSHFIKTPDKPYVYVCSRSEMTPTRVLKISLSLSKIYNMHAHAGQQFVVHHVHEEQKRPRVHEVAVRMKKG
ncbi:F-box/LRR-repeat protein At3g48880-like [Pyrus communis]|uniref:F-box/LRR-repeat protein At3g48880-like n=1 Tax=Pyrus communis TaxID=23211 RepID=UPI0035C26539